MESISFNAIGCFIKRSFHKQWFVAKLADPLAYNPYKLVEKTSTTFDPMPFLMQPKKNLIYLWNAPMPILFWALKQPKEAE
jgi:hypothetical protein